MINGNKPGEKVRQFIDCGAVVRLDDAVVEHGVVFIHPDLPPLRLMFQLDPEGKDLPHYGMEPIQPEHGTDTHFAIRVHEVAEPVVQMPDKKLILPEGNS